MSYCPILGTPDKIKSQHGIINLANAHPVRDMAPVIRGYVAGIEADGFHVVDQLKHLTNLGPAIDGQQDFAAGAHERQCLERLAAPDGAHNVDARNDSAMVAARPGLP